ncbi:MAG: DNA repair protein RecN [Ruminococcaceae bacterium]|nr:DNA repair protein RecN [Oscillospiraceae bacterium]
MLSVLHIENIAVIERCDLEFRHGFHVLTGETGAGKSIIIDALNMILGERTSRDLIRSGAEKALVSALFDIRDSDAAIWLSECGYENEDDPDMLLLQREISLDGRNNCRINGRPATVSLLKELGSLLVNIHGQHGSQQLLNREFHATFLDRFTEDPDGLFAQYQSAFDTYTSLCSEEKTIITNEEEKARRIEFLNYQINELTSANLRIGEDVELTERRKVLQNSTKLIDSLSQIYTLFSGTDDTPGITASIQQADRILNQIAGITSDLESWSAGLTATVDSLYDFSENIRGYLDEIDCSPEEIEQIESRYDLIRKLKGKYGNSVEEMLAFLDNARAELDDITFASERAEKLARERKEAQEKAEALAIALFDLRTLSARELETRVSEELHSLDMKNVVFSVSVSKRNTLDRRGLDDVEFLISTNPGEPLKPLEKIASGGELSRIMLAIQNVFAEKDHVPTLIFDEVDSGISGRAAQRVAEKLWTVSGCKQVICVSHLSQIAAMADEHFYIEKVVRNERTYTQVLPLDFDGRVMELARITGGSDITEMTRNNARDLLFIAEQLKKELR